jgi:hypothetical protein
VVRCDPDSPAIDFRLTIEVRKPTRRPVGVHPNLALPHLIGGLQIRPGSFRLGFVHPAGPEPGISRGLPGATFVDLAAVPLLSGGTGRFDRLPFVHDTEEMLQLCGVDGSVVLANTEERVSYELTWDAAILSSLLLWMSNRGRRYAPWNGRNMCVGVEPMTGLLDLGCNASLAVNPLNIKGYPTALSLDPAKPTIIQYRFAATQDGKHDF